jgi:hypothetical protein
MSGAEVLRASVLNAGQLSALAAGAGKLRQLVEAGDPGIIEDLASLSESAPYVISFGEASDPMDCERCRVPVVAVPEALVPGESRRWQRAIWECETGRKHTLRRCEAMQGKAE